MYCRFSNVRKLNIILDRPGQEELVCFFLQTHSQTSPMSVWLPARPEGTKDHRELSAQRGTDMSFSLSIATLPKPHPKHTLCAAVPAGPASAAKSFSSSEPVQMQLSEGQILYSSYRKRGCLSQNALQPPAPELRQMETASIRLISQIWGSVLKAWISSMAVHGTS